MATPCSVCNRRSITPFAMLTTLDGMYVPTPVVSGHPSGYAHHLSATAAGKSPTGTRRRKSSANTWCHPGTSPTGIASPDGEIVVGGAGGRGGPIGPRQAAPAVTAPAASAVATSRRKGTGTTSLRRSSGLERVSTGATVRLEHHVA